MAATPQGSSKPQRPSPLQTQSTVLGALSSLERAPPVNEGVQDRSAAAAAKV